MDDLANAEYLFVEEISTNMNSSSLIRKSLMDLGTRGSERQSRGSPDSEGMIKLVEDTTEFLKDNTMNKSNKNLYDRTEQSRKEKENPKDNLTSIKSSSDKQAIVNMSSADMLIKSLMDVGARGGARQHSRRSTSKVPTPEAANDKDELSEEDVARLEEELVKFPNPSVYYKKKIAARLTKEINVSERLIINWLNENGKRDLPLAKLY